MCKAACNNKCDQSQKCGKAYGQANGHTKDAVERSGSKCGDRNTKNAKGAERGKDISVFHVDRTAQHAPAVKIPVGVNHGRVSTLVIDDAEMPAFDVNAMDEAISSLPTYPYPDEPVPMPKIQAIHEASRHQNAMTEACAIASELGRVSREGDDPEPLATLMRHVSTQEHATLQLLKLVGRIGLRQWFDGDFVVLPTEVAGRLLDDSASQMDFDLLEEAIERAKQ